MKLNASCLGSTIVPHYNNYIWHVHLAHLSKFSNVFTTLQLSFNTINKCKCEIFPIIKSHKLSFTHSHKYVTTHFELLYIDLWLSVIVVVIDAYYFLFIVDDFS